MLRGAKQANINDTNIQPFKSCSAIGICQPALIGTWEKNTDVKVRDKPALLDISTIQCMHGGIISIDDAGQKEVGTATTKTEEVKEAKRDADCQYKLLINICSDINNNFMQTQLKKEAQKYAKWKKYKAGVMDDMRSYFAKDVKNMLGMRKLSESEKKNKENFIKVNKAKMQIANQEVTPEKEKYLRKKIYAVFKEAYKSVKQKSGPKFDTKGVIRNHGLSLCDYERKNFYSAKMLPVITYGYLMRAGNLTITENSKRLIESELNNDINTTNTGQIKLQNYKIQSNVRQTKTIPKQRIKSSDVANWIGIGKMLYTSIKHAPTANDILNGIRKNGRSVAVCPFSQGEWDDTHNSSKSNNTAQKKTENTPKMDIKEDTAKYQSNVLNSKSSIAKSVAKNTKVESNAKSQNNTKNSQTVTSCKTCPHTGVQGKYILDVVRIEERSLGTLSTFRILDPSGREVSGFNGYVVEREGPDTIVSGRKKRIVQGMHQLRWHQRPDKIKNGKIIRKGYLAVGIFNHTENPQGLEHKRLKKKVLIHENRFVLIHPVGVSSGLEGCLAPARNYKTNGDRYVTQGSQDLFNEIIKFIKKIDEKKVVNHNELIKFRLRVSNKISK